MGFNCKSKKETVALSELTKVNHSSFPVVLTAYMPNTEAAPSPVTKRANAAATLSLDSKLSFFVLLLISEEMQVLIQRVYMIVRKTKVLKAPQK